MSKTPSADSEIVGAANIPRCPYCKRDLVLAVEERKHGKTFIALMCSKHGAVQEKWRSRLEPIRRQR